MIYAETDLEMLWRRAFLRCRAAGASTEDARDCAQDAITELLAHQDVERPKAWVATVAFHRYVDLCRQRGREHCAGLVPLPATGAADSPGPEEQAVGREHARWLVDAMESWPESTRLVCSAVGAGIPQPEIVNQLGLTHRAVESHLTRARRLLRTLSLLAVSFAVALSRALRRAISAGRPAAPAALLMPSVATLLILGGSEPPVDAHPAAPPGASAPQSAGPEPSHPAAPVSSNPPLGTAPDQAPDAAAPLTDPAAPSASTGAPDLEAPGTPDTPTLPIEPPSGAAPAVDTPPLPINPPQLPGVQTPTLPINPPQLPGVPTPTLPINPPQLPGVPTPTLPINPPQLPGVPTPTLPLPSLLPTLPTSR